MAQKILFYGTRVAVASAAAASLFYLAGCGGSGKTTKEIPKPVAADTTCVDTTNLIGKYGPFIEEIKPPKKKKKKLTKEEIKAQQEYEKETKLLKALLKKTDPFAISTLLSTESPIGEAKKSKKKHVANNQAAAEDSAKLQNAKDAFVILFRRALEKASKQGMKNAKQALDNYNSIIAKQGKGKLIELMAEGSQQSPVPVIFIWSSRMWPEGKYNLKLPIVPAGSSPNAAQDAQDAQYVFYANPEKKDLTIKKIFIYGNNAGHE